MFEPFLEEDYEGGGGSWGPSDDEKSSWRRSLFTQPPTAEWRWAEGEAWVQPAIDDEHGLIMGEITEDLDSLNTIHVLDMWASAEWVSFSDSLRCIKDSFGVKDDVDSDAN